MFYKYRNGHGVEKLHVYIEFFFTQMFARKGKRYNYQSVIHSDFKDVVEKCNKLNLLLRKTYQQYNKLNSSDQIIVESAFHTNNKIEELCRGELDPVHNNQLPSSFAKVCFNLFVYLYEDLPITKVFQDNVGDFFDYYQEIRKINPEITMCPFCGLNFLKPKNDIKRDDYDHYLPKAIYLFNGINLKNLVPICKECNSDEKFIQDPLYHEKNKVGRRKVFYPYDSSIIGEHVQVKIEGDDTDNLNVILDGKEEKKEEIESWNIIFGILRRYNAVTRASQERWIEDLHREYGRQRKKAGFNFRLFLTDELERLSDNILVDRVFLKKALYDWLASNPDLERNLELTVT